MRDRPALAVARGLILLASSSLLGGCHHKRRAPEPQPPPGEVWLSEQQISDAKIAVEPVAEHVVSSAILTSGRITFEDLRVTRVYSPLSGQIVRILVSPGEHVKKGAGLAVIASPELGQVSSDLDKARADLDVARQDYLRQRDLYVAHAASQRDFQAALGAYRRTSAEAARASKKARLLGRLHADVITQQYTLTSEIEGEVIVRAATPGLQIQGTLGGGQSPELFVIGQLDSLWVLADVFEMDLPRVRLGARATTRVVSYPTKRFTGTVDWISGALDPSTRTATVRCSVENIERLLRPEMYATVSLAATEQRAVSIPRPALLRLGEQTIVFVNIGTTPTGLSRFERRPVTVDTHVEGHYVPITHGLAPGDQIVTTNAILLLGML